MIAVMGAAGNVGSKVTGLLLRRNEEVRVFEHERKLEEFGERGAEVVAGDAVERLVRRDFTGHQAKMLLGPEDVSMREVTHAMGSLLGLPELPYVEFPLADMKGALLAAGMSEEAASLLVDMQLALDEGRPFDGVQRTAEATTPTRLEEYLGSALSRSRVH